MRRPGDLSSRAGHVELVLTNHRVAIFEVADASECVSAIEARRDAFEALVRDGFGEDAQHTDYRSAPAMTPRLRLRIALDATAPKGQREHAMAELPEEERAHIEKALVE